MKIFTSEVEVWQDRALAAEARVAKLEAVAEAGLVP